MRFTYLGTAAAEGWPALFCNCKSCQTARAIGGPNIRTRSQALVNDSLLIDFPADTYMHVLQHKFDLSAIELLLITHSHSDHFYPMEFEMRGDPYAHNMTQPILSVVSSQDVINTFHQVTNGCIPQKILNHFHFIPITTFEPITLCGYRITALHADHMPSEQAHFYMIEKDGQTILYCHDTGYFPADTWEYLASLHLHLDFVSLDCTFCLRSNSSGHMGLEANLRVCDRLRELGLIDTATKVFINHFSHNGNVTHEQLCTAAAKYGIAVAYDGLSISF